MSWADKGQSRATGLWEEQSWVPMPAQACSVPSRSEGSVSVTRVRDHLGVRGPSSPAGAGRARTKAQRLENRHVPRLQGLGVWGWVPTGGQTVPGAWAPSCGQREAFGATVGPLWQGGCGRPSANRPIGKGLLGRSVPLMGGGPATPSWDDRGQRYSGQEASPLGERMGRRLCPGPSSATAPTATSATTASTGPLASSVWRSRHHEK